MVLAVDYASGPIAPAALLAAGVTDVCRYLAPLGRGDWKRIKAGEYRDLLAAGLRVTLVWESYATDWLGGAAAGREHGVEAGRQATDLGYPPGATVFGSCDFDLAAADWPACRDYVAAFAAALHAAGYRPGVYGPWDALQRCADADLVEVFWQAGMSRAWSGGRNARDHPRAHLIQRAPARIGGTPVDRSDIIVPAWGQASTSGAVMTYAPADLLAVRQYVMGRTGLPANAVGVAGDDNHPDGYHVGNDALAAVGRLTSDYSKRESPRDRPGTNAASALDIGDFNRDGKTLRGLSLFLVGRCEAGDPRATDIREIIYTPDGKTVRRWDRLGIRSTGDSSHLYHTHFSFFRDSEGRRNAGYLALLEEYFEGAPSAVTTGGTDVQMLIKASDSPQVWLVDGQTRRPIPAAWVAAVGNSQTHQAGLLGLLGNGGNVFVTGPTADLDVWGIDLEAEIADRIQAYAAADAVRDAALAAAVADLDNDIASLRAVVDAGGGDVDSAAILARLDALQAKLAAAAQAGADILAT